MASSIHRGEDLLQSLPSLEPTGSALSFGLSQTLGPFGGANRLGLAGDRTPPTSSLTGTRELLRNLLREPDSTRNRRPSEQQSHMPWADLTRLPSPSVDGRLASVGIQPPLLVHRPSSAVDPPSHFRGGFQQQPDHKDLQQGNHNPSLPAAIEGGHGSHRGRPPQQGSHAQELSRHKTSSHDMSSFVSSQLIPTSHPPLSLPPQHNVGSVFPQYPSFTEKAQSSSRNQATGLIRNESLPNIHPDSVPRKDASQSEQRLDRIAASSSGGAKEPVLPLRPPIMYRYDPSDRGRDRDSFFINTDDTISRKKNSTTLTTETRDFDDTTTPNILAHDVPLDTAFASTPGGSPDGTPTEYSNDLPTSKIQPIILTNTKPASAPLGTRYPDIVSSSNKDFPFRNRTHEVHASSNATTESHITKSGPANFLSSMATKARPPDAATGIDQPQASAREDSSQGEREATSGNVDFIIDGAAEPPTPRALVHIDSYDAEWTEFPLTETVSPRHAVRPFENGRNSSGFTPSIATLAKQASHPSSQSFVDMADIQTSIYPSNAASTSGQQLKGFPPKVDDKLQANAYWTHLDAPWVSTLRGHFASNVTKSSREREKELLILPPSAFQPPDYSSSDEVPNIKGRISDVDAYRNPFRASVKDGRRLDGSWPLGVLTSATRRYTGDDERGVDGGPAESSDTLPVGDIYGSSKKGNFIELPDESTQNKSGVLSWWYKTYNHSF